MNYLHFLRRYYSLYTTIRFRTPGHPIEKWVTSIVRYIQVLFICMKIQIPSKTLNPENNGMIDAVQSFICIYPWIFNTDSMLFDTSIIFFVFLCSITTLIWSSKICERGDNVPTNNLRLIRLFQSIIAPIIMVPVIYRFAKIIGSFAYEQEQKLFIFSFFLMLFDIGMIFFCILMNSIFMEPFCFISNSVLDVFDGKTTIVAEFIRFMLILISYTIGLISDVVAKALLIVFILFMLIIVIYYRCFKLIHVSLIGTYIEVAPICTIPIAIIVHVYIGNAWWKMIISQIITHLFVIMIIRLINYLMNQQAKIVFSYEINDEDEELLYQSPTTSSLAINFVSMLRYHYLHNGNPMLFDRYYSNPERFGIRASAMIEIVRFLGIFPSRREAMLEELKIIKSSSNYNRFMIYLLIKTLKGLLNYGDSKHLHVIDDLQRSLIINNYLFWKSRYENRKLDALRYSCKAAYYFYEAKQEYVGLVKRFAFDSSLYQRYADFLKLFCGNFDGAKRVQSIILDLEVNRSIFADPILHPISCINPRVLQYCNEEEVRTSYYSTNQETSYNHISFASHSEPNQPIASYVIQSKYAFIYVMLFTYIVPSFLYLLYIALLSHIRNMLASNIKESSIYMEDFKSSYYIAGSSSFIPFIGLAVFDDLDEPNETLCREFIYNVPKYNYEFFSLVPLIKYFQQYIYQFFTLFFRDAALYEFTSCDIVFFLNELSIHIMGNIYARLDMDLLYIINHCGKSEYILRRMFFLREFIIIAGIIGIFSTTVFFIFLFNKVNYVFKDQEDALCYLSSKSRLTLMLLEKSDDAWECLLSYLPLKTPSASNNFSMSESRVDTRSGSSREIFDSTESGEHHIELKKNRISVSFTGVATKLFTTKKSPETKSAPASDDSMDQNLALDDDLSDGDNIDYTLLTISDKTKYAHCMFFIEIIITWIMLVVVLTLMFIPIHSVCLSSSAEYQMIITKMEQSRYAFFLLQHLIEVNYDDSIPKDSIIRNNRKLLEYNTKITDLYTKERCMTLNGYTCAKTVTLVENFINGSTYLETTLVTIPALISFCELIMNTQLDTDITNMLHKRDSIPYGFFVFVALMLLLFVYDGVKKTMIWAQSFNSLFHFPISLIQKDTDEDSKEKDLSLPSNVISVLSDQQTDEIYSISENSTIIFNKPSTEFIGCKFSDMFPLANQTENETRFHIMPDKHTKKVFRSQTTTHDILNSTIMVEESKNSSRPLYMNKYPIATKMMNFVPSYFAKLYGDDEISTFYYKSPYLIHLRINVDVPIAQVEKFFSFIHALTMNYSRLKIANAQNGTILIISVDEISPLIVLMFIRDIIIEGMNISKGNKNIIIPLAFTIDIIDEIDAKINIKNEPFLELAFDTTKYERILYMIEKRKIALSEQFIHKIPEVAKLGNRKDKEEKLIIPFDTFLQNLSLLI